MPTDPANSRVRFEDHVGELVLVLESDSLEGLFAEAARVVSRECGEAEGPPGSWERVELAARDAATLLADWLNELIGRSEVEGRAFAEVRGLTIGATSGPPADETRLAAEIRGRAVSRWTSALKAATYHGLELARSPNGWRARVLFDV